MRMALIIILRELSTFSLAQLYNDVKQFVVVLVVLIIQSLDQMVFLFSNSPFSEKNMLIHFKEHPHLSFMLLWG